MTATTVTCVHRGCGRQLPEGDVPVCEAHLPHVTPGVTFSTGTARAFCPVRDPMYSTALMLEARRALRTEEGVVHEY